jgi:hypothetical protein
MKKSNITLIKKFKPALFFSFFFVFLLVELLLTASPAFGACECSTGEAFGPPPWTAPDACFTNDNCQAPCERTFTGGPPTPAGMTYVCTTTGGGAPSGGTPSGSTPATTDESATKTIPLQNPLGGTPENPLGVTSVPRLIGNIIKTVLAIVGALALAMFIYGGFTWLTSGGSAEKIKKGKDILIWAVIGLVVIFASYSLVDFLLTAFGVSS